MKACPKYIRETYQSFEKWEESQIFIESAKKEINKGIEAAVVWWKSLQGTPGGIGELDTIWVYPWLMASRQRSEYGGETISLDIVTSSCDLRTLAEIYDS